MYACTSITRYMSGYRYFMHQGGDGWHQRGIHGHDCKNVRLARGQMEINGDSLGNLLGCIAYSVRPFFFVTLLRLIHVRVWRFCCMLRWHED